MRTPVPQGLGVSDASQVMGVTEIFIGCMEVPLMTVSLPTEGQLIAESEERGELHHPWRLVEDTGAEILRWTTLLMIAGTTGMR